MTDGIIVAGVIGLGNHTQLERSEMRRYCERVRDEEYKPNKDLRARWLKMFFRVAVNAEAVQVRDLPPGFLGDLTEREKNWEL